MWHPGDSDRTGRRVHALAEVRAGILSFVPVEIETWKEHLLYKAQRRSIKSSPARGSAQGAQLYMLFQKDH
jgi:hypothetical protein